jgi:hypothetical protein
MSFLTRHLMAPQVHNLANIPQCELVGAQASTERTLSFVLNSVDLQKIKFYPSVCDPPLAGLAQSYNIMAYIENIPVERPQPHGTAALMPGLPRLPQLGTTNSGQRTN